MTNTSATASLKLRPESTAGRTASIHSMGSERIDRMAGSFGAMAA
jgi:hypothetical protein